jgi:hypothetical protein
MPLVSHSFRENNSVQLYQSGEMVRGFAQIKTDLTAFYPRLSAQIRVPKLLF